MREEGERKKVRMNEGDDTFSGTIFLLYMAI